MFAPAGAVFAPPLGNFSNFLFLILYLLAFSKPLRIGFWNTTSKTTDSHKPPKGKSRNNTSKNRNKPPKNRYKTSKNRIKTSKNRIKEQNL